MSGVGLRLDPLTGGIAQTSQTGGVDQTGATGAGSIAGSGPVPTSGTPLFDSVMSALRTMTPNETSGDFEVMLAEITSKLKDALGKVMESRANNEMETKRVSILENQAKIEESKRKLDEAQAKKESGDIFDILSLVFEAIGAAVMAAIGAVLVATGVGATAGVALLAASALMFVSLANSITAKLNDGAGILGSIAKAIGEAAGADPADIATAVGVMDGAFAVGMLVAGIALAVVSGGASAESGVSTFLKAMTKTAEIATQLSTAASQLTSASFKMSAAVDTRDAKVAQADSMELQAMMQQLDDMIDMAMALLMQVNQSANAMLDTLTQMLNDQASTLANTRFAG